MKMRNIYFGLVLLAVMALVSSCGTVKKISNSSRLPVKEKEANRKWVDAPIKPAFGKTAGARKNEGGKWVAPSNKSKSVASNKNKPTEAIPFTSYKGKHKEMADKIIKEAKTYIATPYKWGGTNRNGIDCSALMMNSFKVAGIQLPRTADAQAQVGKPIARTEVKPGDVIFFDTMQPGKVGHAGLVVANDGQDISFIHASVKGGVRIDVISNPYWKKYFLFARRLMP